MGLNVLSLFSGIGGPDLAAQAAGMTTVGFVEWDPWCQALLHQHWPTVPVWGDIRAFTKGAYDERSGGRRVDLVTGGFPCQPFSTAGKRRGTDDTRYLWPEMLRVIEEFHPAWVVGENVAGFVGMGLDIALAGLESKGYEATAFVVPAVSVGAPHLRQRVFIVAHNMRIGQQEQPQCDSLRRRSASEARSGDGAGTGGGSDRGNRPKGAGVGAGDPCVLSTPVAHAPELLCDGKHDHAGSGERPEAVPEPGDSGVAETLADAASKRCAGSWKYGDTVYPAAHGEGQATKPVNGGFGSERSPEPRLGGTAHGLSAWLDKVREQTLWQGDWEGETPRVTTERCDVANRLKALGNACVPSQIYPIFKAIADIEGATLWN